MKKKSSKNSVKITTKSTSKKGITKKSKSLSIKSNQSPLQFKQLKTQAPALTFKNKEQEVETSLKLSNKIKAEILKTYHTIWDAVLKGDMKTFASYLDSHFTIYGSAEGEIFNSKKAAAKFYEATADEMTGKVDLRKRRIGIKMIGNAAIINEECDLYVLTGKDWTFYGHARISEVLEQDGKTWKISHHHTSFPDHRTEAGQQLAVEKIKAENIQLREAVKRRTVELERKNRELAIEAAMEKVRARSLAMQKPEELVEVAELLRMEMGSLGVEELETSSIYIVDESKGTTECWYAIKDVRGKNKKLVTDHIKLHLNETWVGREMQKFYDTRAPRTSILMRGKNRKEWINYCAEKSSVLQGYYGDEIPERTYHLIKFSNGFMGAASPGEISQESWGLLQRATSVFSFAYKRFSDLKLAEAQAREAQIETALERVRSRSMAMHKSDELKDVIKVVLEQFVQLNINVGHAGFYIDYKAHDDMHIWLADPNIEPFFAVIPYFDTPTWNSFIEAKVRGTMLHTDLLDFKTKNKFYKSLFKLFAVPEEAQQFYMQCKGLAVSTVLLENVGLYIENFSAIPYTDEENEILIRFGKVFQQTYTRFLDLQKAEAQAREAQIEAALERVRAKTMAMHKSEQLPETAQVLFEQFAELGKIPDRISIGIIKEESQLIEWWATDQSGSKLALHFDASIHGPTIGQYFAAWKEGKESIMVDLSGEALKDWVTYVRDVVKMPIDDSKMKGRRVHHGAFFSQGLLLISAHEPMPKETLQLLVRFANVFSQTYTRFLDLQKAEAQAREAKIEAALERVRSRSMAMHDSKELGEVAKVMFSQMKMLGGELFAFGIVLCDKQKSEVEQWHGLGEGDMMTPFRVPVDLDYIHRYRYDQWKAGVELFSVEIPSDYIARHFELMFDLPSVKAVMDDLKAKGIELAHPSWEIDYGASFRNGYLLISSLQPFKEDKIFPRFAKVFEQAYTRFLDLQKAEAQARDARIEAALERVRSKMMAMHNSKDVGVSVASLFDELTGLGVLTTLDRCGIGIMKPEEMMEVWTAENSKGKTELTIGYLDMKPHVLLRSVYQSWLDKKETFRYTLAGEDKHQYAEAIFNQSNYKIRRDYFSTIDKIEHTDFFFKEGCLYVFSSQELSAEATSIFIRFTNLFGQTYRRYLDLQKAEAQAREAQIEAALERVRSRSLAMHKSSEIQEVVAVVFTQLQQLGLNFELLGIGTRMENSNDIYLWIGNGQNSYANQFLFPNMDFGPSLDVINAFDNQVAFFSRVYSFEEKNHFWKHAFEHSDFRHLPEARKQYILDSPSFSLSVAPVRNILFQLIDYTGKVATEQEAELVKRFAKVFEQCYVRFQDLEKAEAQAREATISAALEKVRGKAMAMHSSQDLDATIHTFYTELSSMELTPRRCGLGLLDKENRMVELSTMHTTPEGISFEAVGKFELVNHPVWEGIYEHWLQQKEYHPVLRGNEIKEYYQLVRKHMAFPDFPGDAVQYGYFFFFEEGGVYAWTDKELHEDELNIYRRFTSVISLTYKRYKDLKDAEVRAKEAVKQAALDRVRAEIASMRTIQDLDRITPLIWRELTTLGVTFVRCGVFIMDNEENKIHTFLSTPDGKAIAAFHLPYDAPGRTKEILANWRNKQVYIEHWDETAFSELGDLLVQQGALPFKDVYLKTIPYGGIHLHCLPFQQGMLYVGNTEKLEAEDIQLIQSVADAFSTAYARYEDFNKLEAAKKQVDSTLSELKTTQKQLIQAEKMASLGELTAGIAHEIQNPLNFVNNFSEVSSELVAELNEEIAKGNIKDAKEIANDLKQNLNKINHHGKRAADIVKGMLQHSRTSTGQKELTDINALADEYLRLAYHGLRAKDKSFNAKFETHLDPTVPKINVVPQDIGRVILNLINNAFYAVTLRLSKGDASYQPTVWVSTKNLGDKIEISVKDNGPGIPDSIKEKIFQPFFTTKPTGQGTGLGLSLSYDIVKAHGGELKVESKEDIGTEFLIILPY